MDAMIIKLSIMAFMVGFVIGLLVSSVVDIMKENKQFKQWMKNNGTASLQRSRKAKSN